MSGPHDPNDGPESSTGDRPWTEDQWEAFMKRGDARSAKFGELLETLRDDPDRDATIAREMGWDDDDDSTDAGGPTFELPAEHFVPADDGDAGVGGGAKDRTDDRGRDEGDLFDDDDDDEEEEDELDAIPAYRLAFDVGMKIHEALKPYTDAAEPGPGAGRGVGHPAGPADDDTGELFGKAFIGCHIAAAKIAGGHGMGYEDDVLCGNIVNCRRGLAGVDEAITALADLKARRALPAALADELVADAGRVKAAVEARIAELRARVWWA